MSLADFLYGGSNHLTTINMSEFKEEHKVSLLLGSPPGYVGYGEGGVLTEAVRRRPFGVLLLDEIDKAHAGVQDIFYQVFDKGVVRDGEGRDVDFKNTTIVLTANTGSELLSALAADPETMPEGEALEALLMPELTKQFKPAFLGRTIILPFMPLGAEPALKDCRHSDRKNPRSGEGASARSCRSPKRRGRHWSIRRAPATSEHAQSKS